MKTVHTSLLASTINPAAVCEQSADYIFVRGDDKHEFFVKSCRLGGTECSPDDDTLYASDHFGVFVELELEIDSGTS